jgi:uncharacterized protein VirK/YbjX
MSPHLPSSMHVTAVGIGALTWHLAQLAKASHPGFAPKSLWRASRLFVGKMRWLGRVRSWYNDASNPALLEMLERRPELVCVIERPYVNTAWTARRRLDAIELHYRQVQGPLNFLRFAPEAPLHVGRLTEGEIALDIVLEKPAWFVHEGEVSMSLFRGEQRLYSLVFVLGRSQNDKLTAYVGALQGIGDAQALDIYRQLTHGLHGLRPRDLLVNAFRMLSKHVGIERILAVSDSNSMARSSYFENKKAHSSYDEVWLDHRGVRLDCGFFELSTTPARRAPDEIASRKRAQYRRRYEMLDALEAQMSTALGAA